MRNLFICLLLYPLLAIAQSERITDIYVVRFGESYENAKESLQKRLGTPYDVSVEDDFFSVCFENAEYEGITFHNLYFFGNISGSSSFFNGAFMQIFCASKEDAEKTCRQMKTTLAKKYTIDEFTNDDGSLMATILRTYGQTGTRCSSIFPPTTSPSNSFAYLSLTTVSCTLP